MKKYTLREIKRFVSLGLAQDITTANCPAIKEPFEKIGVSRGIYGINGGLLRGQCSGTIYAITARNSNLFYYF
ncbi:MAG: hypothetical protein SOY17_12175 [Evtepia sp.]|nr:hypothetical protein [Evtepia sp.]